MKTLDGFLIRSHECSLTDYGRYPGSRSVEELIKNGLVVIDKPPGPTSHQVTSWVKEILGVKKAGHAGTLDPRVSGVLVIALENATKVMPILSACPKSYIALMHLHRDVPEEKIITACRSFIGKITQIPPRKSAVARRPRKKEIYSIEVLEIQGRDVLMKIDCEAGVYIRKLCVDIGTKLGVRAHMQELRRIKSGPFSEEMCVTLQTLKDAYVFWKEEGNEELIRSVVLPVERAVDAGKCVIVKDSAVDALCNGAPLSPGGIVAVQKGIKKGETISILTLKGELVAIGIAEMDSNEMVRRKRGTAVKTDRVLMPRGDVSFLEGSWCSLVSMRASGALDRGSKQNHQGVPVTDENPREPTINNSTDKRNPSEIRFTHVNI